MTTKDYERELGRINSELHQLKEDNAEIKKSVNDMRDLLMGAQGSWKILAVVGTLLGSVITGILIKVGAKWF